MARSQAFLSHVLLVSCNDIRALDRQTDFVMLREFAESWTTEQGPRYWRGKKKRKHTHDPRMLKCSQLKCTCAMGSRPSRNFQPASIVTTTPSAMANEQMDVRPDAAPGTSEAAPKDTSKDFYVRYYTGHYGKYGHEFLEFEYSRGRIRYANNSNYRSDDLIKKEMWVTPLLVEEIKRIVEDSEIVKEDDSKWPPRNSFGRQELEVRLGDEHISFETSKIGSLVDVQDSDDPEGLRVFYYLVQDLKVCRTSCFLFAELTAYLA